MAALLSTRDLSRGRAPRPRAAASAEAPASPTGILRFSEVMAGSAPVPSPSASRCTPSGLAEPDLPSRTRYTSAGSTEPSVPSIVRSGTERPLLAQWIFSASRSSLQLRTPILRHSAAAAW
eukprot:scaffold11561_cov72-Phaeocystis_antarctica.AAC.1